MKTACLHIDGQSTGLRIGLALSWWRRAVGLLATARLDDPCGLWIRPCNSVHTLGMRYPIDVVFLDAQGRVTKLVPALKPWRAAGCRGARSVLELRAGLAASLGMALNSQLDWTEAPVRQDLPAPARH